MDDSPVLETKTISTQNNTEEIDPLDAYMLEIDEQVHKLEERDKLKEAEDLAVRKQSETAVKHSEKTDENEGDEDEDDEETIGKAGNFSTVEELIA